MFQIRSISLGFIFKIPRNTDFSSTLDVTSRYKVEGKRYKVNKRFGKSRKKNRFEKPKKNRGPWGPMRGPFVAPWGPESCFGFGPWIFFRRLALVLFRLVLFLARCFRGFLVVKCSMNNSSSNINHLVNNLLALNSEDHWPYSTLKFLSKPVKAHFFTCSF